VLPAELLINWSGEYCHYSTHIMRTMVWICGEYVVYSTQNLRILWLSISTN